jgi:predicted enzyme related to lactoylglutathione lyase
MSIPLGLARRPGEPARSSAVITGESDMAKNKNGHTHGRFVWHELTTPDPKRAVGFYGELFAWKSREVDMGPAGTYTVLTAGETDVGGIATPQPGQPAHWLGYCTVEDPDATAKKARELGATVAVPPTDIPDIGRFTLLVDPQGAAIAPIRMVEEAPEGDDKPALGTFCWDELHTHDPSASLAFHTKLFGWKPNAMDMGPAGTYQVLEDGDKQRGGLMKKPMAEAPTMWLAYVVVDDVDRSAARAEKLGGKVLAPASDIPNIGRYAVVADPTGGVIALYKSAS